MTNVKVVDVSRSMGSILGDARDAVEAHGLSGQSKKTTKEAEKDTNRTKEPIMRFYRRLYRLRKEMGQ